MRKRRNFCLLPPVDTRREHARPNRLINKTSTRYALCMKPLTSTRCLLITVWRFGIIRLRFVSRSSKRRRRQHPPLFTSRTAALQATKYKIRCFQTDVFLFSKALLDREKWGVPRGSSYERFRPAVAHMFEFYAYNADYSLMKANSAMKLTLSLRELSAGEKSY